VAQAVEVGADLVHEAEPDLVGDDLLVQDPRPGLGHSHRLRQELVHLQHLDAAVAHLGDEVEVIPLGVVDPQHVVEQQCVAVRRGEALVGAAGGAHQDLAELAHLGVDAELRGSRFSHVDLSPSDRRRPLAGPQERRQPAARRVFA
jgi:hypothetical protein